MEIRITGSQAEYEQILEALDRVIDYQVGDNSKKRDPERFSVYLYNIKVKTWSTTHDHCTDLIY